MGIATILAARQMTYNGAALSADRVEWHLWNWERWCTFSSLPGKYPNHASGGIRGYTNFDFEAGFQEADRRAGEATNAVIYGLPDRLRVTVLVRHNMMSAVYRIRGDADAAYLEACAIIGTQMAKRGFC